MAGVVWGEVIKLELIRGEDRMRIESFRQVQSGISVRVDADDLIRPVPDVLELSASLGVGSLLIHHPIANLKGDILASPLGGLLALSGSGDCEGVSSDFVVRFHFSDVFVDRRGLRIWISE